MEEGSNRVRLRIDLATGTIELDAPAENFTAAIEKTKELAATLDLPGRSPPVASANAPPLVATTTTDVPPPPATPAARIKVRGPKPGARVGRLGSYEPIHQLLTEPQEIELRAFMSEKAPSDQSDRVLTAMVKGEQLLNRRGLTYNEIYTLMWLGGIKDLPKALDVVLGKMIQDQLVVREAAGFAVKFIGRNHIENDLPKRETS